MRSRRTNTLSAIGVIVGVGLTLQVCASEPSRPGGRGPGDVADGRLSDANILALLEFANTADIEAGQIAQQRGSDPRVKQYASRMSTDHVSMLNDGAALAKHLMVVPVMPDEGRTMMKEHADSMRALRAKSGADFDRAYIEHEIDMHQKVLDQVQKAVKEADRTDLRYLLEKTRPDLEDHLKEAQDIRKRLAS